jgi:Fe-S cluster biogenesis protein NfuA
MRVRAERVEQLAHQLELIAEPGTQAVARELVQAVTDLHAAGLERVLEILSGSTCAPLIDQLGADPLVGSLMAIHGLHPLELEERVARAMNLVSESLLAHGGEAELLGIDEGQVRLLLKVQPQGCGSSTSIARTLLEDAIYDAAPDLASLSVDEVTISPSSFVPLEVLTTGIAR